MHLCPVAGDHGAQSGSSAPRAMDTSSPGAMDASSHHLASSAQTTLVLRCPPKLLPTLLLVCLPWSGR